VIVLQLKAMAVLVEDAKHGDEFFFHCGCTCYWR
jgi:hypothetical protein